MEAASDFPSDRKSRDQSRGEEHRPDRLAEALEENSRLQAARLYLASIVESSHDAIMGVDLKGLVTAWNAAAERVFGYRPDEIVGRPVATLFPPSRHDSESQLIQRVAGGETLTHYRTQSVRKDGAVLDVSLTLSPIRDADGIIIGASKIVDDVTEQMLKERHMRRLEAHRDYLADLVESSNDAIVAGTLDGRIASWNKAAEIRGTSAIMRDITEERAAEERLKSLQAELIHLSRWNTMGMMASTLAHE